MGSKINAHPGDEDDHKKTDDGNPNTALKEKFYVDYQGYHLPIDIDLKKVTWDQGNKRWVDEGAAHDDEKQGLLGQVQNSVEDLEKGFESVQRTIGKVPIVGPIENAVVNLGVGVTKKVFHKMEGGLLAAKRAFDESELGKAEHALVQKTADEFNYVKDEVLRAEHQVEEFGRGIKRKVTDEIHAIEKVVTDSALVQAAVQTEQAAVGMVKRAVGKGKDAIHTVEQKIEDVEKGIEDQAQRVLNLI
jgi:hypothetical protein